MVFRYLKKKQQINKLIAIDFAQLYPHFVMSNDVQF